MASSAQASPRQRISSADLDAFDDFNHINNNNNNNGGNRSLLSDATNNNKAHHQHIIIGKSIAPTTNNQKQLQGWIQPLPFELSRNRNTDWIAEGGPSLLLFYLLLILVVLLTFLAFVPEPKLAWTLTNLRMPLGNPADYMDGTQGEMNAMTCWEQIVSKPAIHHLDTRARTYSDASTGSNMDQHYMGLRQRMTVAIKKLRSRDVLCVIPTLLAHASCHVAKYQSEYVLVNVGMPFMNGVRLFGINRTIGIDDGAYETEEDDDDCANDTEEDSTNDESLGLEIINEETKKTR
ncbi:hypothetical protein QTG54_002986 [Skeletonema marinoi]|uniref:Uncharacterized protein n=1 Tax=Skeletonema marinoi TaxID=267567 RepID=A0AAD8YGX3_9STRA|nr:hypothetical protein QTG54_002986 [Skeletonema marinoi]